MNDRAFGEAHASVGTHFISHICIVHVYNDSTGNAVFILSPHHDPIAAVNAILTKPMTVFTCEPATSYFGQSAIDKLQR